MTQMVGGPAVPEYSEVYKFCGYCGNSLTWSERSFGFSPVTGQPFRQRTYGCTRYGKNYHYFWWEEDSNDTRGISVKPV